jgi:hypothetical protein
MKPPSSMRNQRLNTSKYRGKLQKMGVLYIPLPRSPGPCYMHGPFKKIKKLKRKKNIKKNTAGCDLVGCGRRATTSRWPAAWGGRPPGDHPCPLVACSVATNSRHPPLRGCFIFALLPPPFFSPSSPIFGHFGQLILIGARPAHTSPNNFKRP